MLACTITVVDDSYMRNLIRRSPALPLEPNYEGMDGQKEWTGLWRLQRYNMRWVRPVASYERSLRTGKVQRWERTHQGPYLRPSILRNVVHLDVPHAVLRSHPDNPQSLPEDLEGMWIDTNPAWPEISIDCTLGRLGLVAVWKETSPDITESFDLVPDFAEGVNPDEAEPLDTTPLALVAPRIFVRPGTAPES